jgi:hypothetical protein
MAVHTDRQISKSIDKLLVEVVRSGKSSLIVQYKGVTYDVTLKFCRALRERNDQDLSKASRASRKVKDMTPDKRTEIVDYLQERVSYALSNAEGIKVSPGLKKVFFAHIQSNLAGRKTFKKSTFEPRRLFYVDDHLTTFIKNIKLGLMSKNTDGSPAVLKELVALEASLLKFLTDNQIGASTVLHSLLVFYTNSHGLREKGGDHNATIRMDDNLKALMNAPMDSAFKGKSLASKYSSVKTADRPLAIFRNANPKSSVMEYLRTSASPEEDAHLKNGYFMGKHIMSLVSAHLIPASSFDEKDQKNLSKDKDDAGHFVNPMAETLRVLQAAISISNKEDTHRPSVAPARSPSASRSPRRALSRSASRTPKRR